MSTIKKYDIPGIDNIPSRYDPLVPLIVEKSDLFFRWQIMVGNTILDNSKLSNYMAIPSSAINFNGPLKPTIDFNLKTLLDNKNLHPGSYSLKLYANRIWKNQGNTKQVQFYIKTISTKKDELVLGVHDPLLNDSDRDQVTAFQDAVEQVLNPATGIFSVDRPVLSLEDGSVVNIISYKIIGANKYTTLELAVKALEPIPKNLKPGSLLKVEIAIIEPREFSFTIPQPAYIEDLNIMALPDFTINSGTSQGPVSSNYETWASLFGTNEDVKNKLLNSVFSGSSATSAELGIDYRKYENFIHFSSAKERLDNFKYKIELIEYYDAKVSALSASTSPSAEINRVQFVTKKNDIVSKFDGYENYLYTESSSYENGSYGIFNASTWPKTDSTIPYTLTSSTAPAFTEWYATQTAAALDYDIDNAYNLEKTIPAHVRLDPENANYLMFVNMIGQSFDQVYNYIDHMDMIHDRQNELHLGLSKDLAWDVLKSLGWHGLNGYNFEDLWSYKLGTDSSGSYQATDSGSTQNHVIDSSMPTEDITKEIWSRTLNNLPHLLSTKGTERSVRALVNLYGLPPTTLRIKEYGGTPKEMSTKQYIKYENSGYSLKFDGSQRIDAPWAGLESGNYSHLSANKTPDIIELRFNASKPQSSILIHNSDSRWGIELEAHPSASNTSSAYHNYGRLWMGIMDDYSPETFVATASAYHPIFDNDWWNIQFGISTSEVFNLHLKKSSDHSNGRITHEEKIAWNIEPYDYIQYGGNWDEDQVAHTISIGNHDPSNSGTHGWRMASGSTVPPGTLPGYTGSIQELRYWAFPTNTILSDAAFDNHVLSPLSIEGNTYTSSYTDLVARWPLGATGVTASLNSTTLTSKHPNQNISTTPFVSAANATMSLSGSGYTGTSADWQYEEETFYTVVPEIIGTRAVSDKIRIINETFSGSLYMDSSVVSSSINISAPDSPLLGVFFSPNDDIDLDISHTIGGAKFDDFVGNPRDAYRPIYKELSHIRNHYWQKYQASPTFGAYLKALKYFDSSLFLQLESLLPARANKQTGLLIKPNLLERPTITRVSQSFANFTYEQVEGVDTTLYSFSTDTPDPLITATAKTYIVHGRDTHVNASSHLPNSFDDSLVTSYGVNNMTSPDVPMYDRMSSSRRYRTQESGSGKDTSVQAQDFLPAGIQNQRYAGSKYGRVGGSIGGIINLVNDPTVTGKGLFDASTNIKCAIEVVETNPVELTTTQGPLTSLGEIQIR
jgi:hypothetical protein